MKEKTKENKRTAQIYLDDWLYYKIRSESEIAGFPMQYFIAMILRDRYLKKSKIKTNPI